MGLATRELRSRSMQISVDSQNTDCFYIVNCRSRSASVLGIAFEDAGRLLLHIKAKKYLHVLSVTCAFVHLCTNRFCQILQHRRCYSCSVDIFVQNQIDLDFRNFHWSWSALLCSKPPCDPMNPSTNVKSDFISGLSFFNTYQCEPYTQKLNFKVVQSHSQQEPTIGFPSLSQSSPSFSLPPPSLPPPSSCTHPFGNKVKQYKFLMWFLTNHESKHKNQEWF